jgi:hypothetical protein
MTTPPSPKTGLSPDDQVTTAADRDHKNGTMVEVFGTYVLAESKDQGTLTGHAAVQLADGTLIHLAPPWHQEAIRPEEERKFVGKPVVAKGLLFAECPPPPDGRAYPRVACLHIGLKVLERSMYDFLHGADPE